MWWSVSVVAKHKYLKIVQYSVTIWWTVSNHRVTPLLILLLLVVEALIVRLDISFDTFVQSVNFMTNW